MVTNAILLCFLSTSTFLKLGVGLFDKLGVGLFESRDVKSGVASKQILEDG